MHRLTIGLGLAFGLFLGCAKDPRGVDGLCDLLNSCGSANFADLADCVDSINKCDGADDRADGCIARNGCDEYNDCAQFLAQDCADPPPADSTSGADTDAEPTTLPQPDDTSVGDPATTTGPVDPATTTGPDDTTSPSSSSADTTAASESTADPSEGDLVAMCKMKANPQTACSDCACENCREQVEACRADEGCTAIRKCAQDNMCSGVGCLGPCGDVINMYGGFGGMSAMLGIDLSNCVGESCVAECE